MKQISIGKFHARLDVTASENMRFKESSLLPFAFALLILLLFYKKPTAGKDRWNIDKCWNMFNIELCN